MLYSFSQYFKLDFKKALSKAPKDHKKSTETFTEIYRNFRGKVPKQIPKILSTSL